MLGAHSDARTYHRSVVGNYFDSRVTTDIDGIKMQEWLISNAVREVATTNYGYWIIILKSQVTTDINSIETAAHFLYTRCVFPHFFPSTKETFVTAVLLRQPLSLPFLYTSGNVI